jgi:hypothetical protein
MSASFINTKKTFSQVVNGVTKLVAALFNASYDEIEAIETFIGAQGTTQSYTSSLKDLLSDYQKGCVVDYKGAADLYVRSGVLVVSDASGNTRIRRNPSDTTVTWAMIDTGSEANSTQYYLYAVADAAATTFTVMISASASAPTGATFYRKIGWFYNNSGGNIQDVVTYNSFTGRMVCDTGWFAQASDTTINHNFGTTKLSFTPYVADDSSGTNARSIADFGSVGGSGYGLGLNGITTTACNVQQGSSGIGNLDDNGVAATYTSGKYIRVILEAIA